jgi:hypothetical protein
MNTTQHTPGPWAKVYGAIMKDGKSICEFREHTSEADQNLIASAPDMFDALQAVCDAYGDRDTLLMAQVKAALDKAKGGAK